MRLPVWPRFSRRLEPRASNLSSARLGEKRRGEVVFEEEEEEEGWVRAVLHWA